MPEDEPLTARELTPGENAYLLRSSASHVWELLQLLAAAEKIEAVKDFLAALPKPAQDHLDTLRALLAGTGPAELRETLVLTRNKSWHYPLPSDKELRRALRELSPYRGVLEAGEKMPSIRAIFADDVMVQFATKFARDREELGRVLSGLADLTIAFVHLTQYALDWHLASLPDEAVRHYAPGEPIPEDEVPELNGEETP